LALIGKQEALGKKSPNEK